MSCYVMSCHVMSCDAMWCDVMWCNMMWCHVMWCHMHVMSCDAMRCDAMWCDAMWCDVMWCNVMLEWILRLVPRTMIPVILNHKSWVVSFHRNTPEINDLVTQISYNAEKHLHVDKLPVEEWAKRSSACVADRTGPKCSIPRQRQGTLQASPGGKHPQAVLKDTHAQGSRGSAMKNRALS